LLQKKKKNLNVISSYDDDGEEQLVLQLVRVDQLGQGVQGVQGVQTKLRVEFSVATNESRSFTAFNIQSVVVVAAAAAAVVFFQGFFQGENSLFFRVQLSSQLAIVVFQSESKTKF